MFPGNDEARAFFKANGYPEQYNDGLLAYLSDLLEVNNFTLPDLLNRYTTTFGSTFDLLFSPSVLFSSSEAGAWWDVQDLTTLYSDAAMTTLAVVDGLVAAHADKSGNGHHRIQTVEASRPTLRQRSDGVYYLDYTGGKSISVPSSTADFNFLHDGTGMTLCAFINYLYGTSTSYYLQSSNHSSQRGIQIQKTPSAQDINLRIMRGIVGTTGNTATIPRIGVSSVPHFFRWSFQDDAVVSIDSSVDTTNYANTNPPEAGDSGIDFQVLNNFNGHEYQLLVIDRVLTETEVSALWHYMKSRNDIIVPNTVDYTFLLGGQSNMSGRGEITVLQPESFLDGVYNYSKAEDFRVAYIPEHSIVNRPIATVPDESSVAIVQHGFALRMGKDLKTNSSVNSLLVPCAIGGTTIAEWDTPSTLDDRTTLLGAMKYRYDKAAIKAGSPVIIWYGHEGSATDAVPDYTNGGVGTTYRDAFISLLNNVRTNIVDAPIILIQLASDDDLAFATSLAAAGEAARQMELSMTDVYLVVAHDVQRNPSTDDVHVARQGQDVIADRVALAIREHILGEAVNGTGPRFSSLSFLGDVVTVTFDKEVAESATDYGDLFRVYSEGIEVTVNSAVRGTNTSTIVLTCADFVTSPLVVSYGYRAGPASAARTDFVQDSDGLPAPVMGPILDPTLLGSELFTGQSSSLNNAAGGATVTHTAATRTISVDVVGTDSTYPRLTLNMGLSVGVTYRVSGYITGDTTNLNGSVPIRLHSVGSSANVPYDPATGKFEGDVTALSNTFQMVVDGTKLGTVTISDLTCRAIL